MLHKYYISCYDELTSGAAGSLPGIFPQHLLKVAVASRFKPSAGYTEDPSVTTPQLWYLHSVLSRNRTVIDAESLDFLYLILVSDTPVQSLTHKAALFVWICFNTPLPAQLVSLGNDPHHHPPDPGFKIASYPQTNSQVGISK